MNEKHMRAQEMVDSLTQNSISSTIVKLTVPMMIANIFGIALEITDAFFVGKLGSDALAAVGMSGIIMFFISTLGVGLGIGTVAMISRAYGEKDFERADHVAAQTILLGIIFSAFLSVVGMLAAPFMFKFLGAEGRVAEIGNVYLRILFAGSVTMFLSFMGASIFQGTGDMKTPMALSAAAAVLNMVLCPIMVFGLLGFPRLEVTGAGIATVLSRFIVCAVMFYIFFKGKHLIHLKKEHFKFDFPIMESLVVIGAPGSLQMLLRSFSAVILTKIVATFGSVIIAAYSIGGRLFNIFLFPGFAFGNAAAILVGQNLGAGNSDRAQASTLLSALYYSIFLTAAGIITFVFARPICAAFNNEPAFVAAAANYVRYISAGSIFLAGGVVISRALQGAGDTMSPMILTGISLYGVQLPVAYLLSGPLGMKETGVWIGSISGSIANTILMMSIFMQGKWKVKKI